MTRKDVKDAALQCATQDGYDNIVRFHNVERDLERMTLHTHVRWAVEFHIDRKFHEQVHLSQHK